MDRKVFPPSPRRLALARRAGLHAASSIVTGALACAAALAAAVMVARSGAARVGEWIAAACGGAPTSVAHDVSGALDRATVDPGALAHPSGALGPGGLGHPSGALGPGGLGHAPGALDLGAVSHAVVELAAPVLIAAALVAAVAHFAQTRTLWLPRRKLEGAPAMPRPPRWLELFSPAVIGATCIAWLWLVAPRNAAVTTAPGVAALLASFVATIACAWAGLGLVDALVRQLALRDSLAMTPAEKREDDRLSSSDPRWRARRSELARTPQIAGAAVVLLGDKPSSATLAPAAGPAAVTSGPAAVASELAAVAISWDPARQPVPFRLATGTGPRAKQLVALARRHRIAIHRDAELARALADSEGAVPDAHWARLAEIIAALRR